MARGVPSHDTLNDVINALPAGLFSECFVAWVEGLRERVPDIVVIDGKTSRRAHAAGGAPLHLVSAWASRQRLVLARKPSIRRTTRSSPFRASRRVSNSKALSSLSSFDKLRMRAMGCRREIAEAIRANYLLALKDNWPTLAVDVRLFFERETAAKKEVCVTVDGDHGRIETRRCRVSHEVFPCARNIPRTTPRPPGPRGF